MSKRKRLITASALILSSAILLTACQQGTTSSSQQTTKQTSTLSTGEVESNLAKVDTSKWLYNAEDDVYYQIGISYAETPTDSSQQTLSIFVPGAYMTAKDNGDGTYTAELNKEATIGNYTASSAPIVIPINTPGYSAMSALTEYSSAASTYTKEGMIYISAGLRGRDSGAPSGVTDAKAAIRYIRYTADSIAGDTDNIFVNGMSGGGAQASIIGTSGDSALYDAYLKEIGAVTGVSDAVAGVMAWCPITNLDTANEAYEWNMGSSRTDLDTQSQTLSDGLAQAYADYINQLKLTDADGNVLSLEESSSGIYQAGSYYDYIKETIEGSLNTFLENTSFPYDASTASSNGMGGPMGTDGNLPSSSDQEITSGASQSSEGASSSETPIESMDNIQRSGSSITLELSGTYETAQDYIAALNAESQWVTYDEKTNTATITSVADFVKYLKSATKSVGAFDSLDLSQGENELFGTGNGGIHWSTTMAKLLKGTDYEAAYTEGLATVDSLGVDLTTRINMYTPLYYLSDYYEDGKNDANVAKYWRIRTGISQGDTALSTEVNLALALENYGVESVDFATVWGQQHVEAEINGDSDSNFISWINESLKADK